MARRRRGKQRPDANHAVSPPGSPLRVNNTHNKYFTSLYNPRTLATMLALLSRHGKGLAAPFAARSFAFSHSQRPPMNDEIQSDHVRVINETGENIGERSRNRGPRTSPTPCLSSALPLTSLAQPHPCEVDCNCRGNVHRGGPAQGQGGRPRPHPGENSSYRAVPLSHPFCHRERAQACSPPALLRAKSHRRHKQRSACG